jgi:hypothetical protein
MKLTRRTKIEFAIVGLLFVAYVVFNWNSLVGVKGKVDRNKGLSIGEIVDYRLVGEANHYLTYEYYVDGNRYENTVQPAYYFKNCYNDQKCFGRKFRVYYSIEEPKLSYIDLYDEIYPVK